MAKPQTERAAMRGRRWCKPKSEQEQMGSRGGDQKAQRESNQEAGGAGLEAE